MLLYDHAAVDTLSNYPTYKKLVLGVQIEKSFNMEQIVDSQLELAECELDNLLSRIDESEFDPTFSGLFPVSAQSDCARVLQPSTSNHSSGPYSCRFVLKSDKQLKEAKANHTCSTFINDVIEIGTTCPQVDIKPCKIIQGMMSD